MMKKNIPDNNWIKLEINTIHLQSFSFVTFCKLLLFEKLQTLLDNLDKKWRTIQIQFINYIYSIISHET